MKNEMENAYGRWLISQGYSINLNDPLWMEDKLEDHSFRDIIALIDKFLDGVEYCAENVGC